MLDPIRQIVVEALAGRQITPYELAIRMKVSPSSIYAKLNPANDIKLSTAIAMLNALDIRIIAK